MIRAATPQDEAAIRQCARLAYEGYTPLMGREPAPMTADFAAQIAAGLTHVYLGEDNRVQGYIVFYPQGDHMLLKAWPCCPKPQAGAWARRLLPSARMKPGGLASMRCACTPTKK